MASLYIQSILDKQHVYHAGRIVEIARKQGLLPHGELQTDASLTLHWWAGFMSPGLSMQDAHHPEKSQAARRQGLRHPTRLRL